MKNFLMAKQEWITTIFRFGFGAFLLYAGGVKALDPAASANATAAYKILPTDLAHLAGYILPWFEVAIAITESRQDSKLNSRHRCVIFL